MAESAVALLPSQLPTLKKAGFKRLKMKHRRIVGLHLQGCSNVEIETVLGHSSGYVSTVLHDPLVGALLESAYADYEMEIRALTPSALDAIRRNMESGDGQVELRAADMALKMNGRYDAPEDKKQTAEDVIERILEMVGADGSRLRYAERRFLNTAEGESKG